VCDNGIPQQCASGIITIHFSALAAPVVLEEAITSVTCFGESNGAISLTLGGDGNIEVTWSDSETGPTRTGLQAGTYEATLTSDAMCAVEGNYTVAIEQPNELQISGLTGYYNGSTAGSSDYTVTGGTEPYSYYWTNDAGEIFWNEKILVSAVPGMFTVTIVDANGCALNATVDAVSAISEAHAGAELELYPNPASDILNVKIASTRAGNAQWRVLDASGRLVLTKNTVVSAQMNPVLFDITNLAPGTYQLSVQLENDLVTRSFVKTN
jgi:hypothetical protein